MLKNTQLFCSKPFKWFEVTHLKKIGEVFMCCPAWLDTSIGNLQDQSVEEIWNGEKAQEIRHSILDGSFKYCNRSRCAFLQTISGPVQKAEDVQEEDLKTVLERKLAILPNGPLQIICTYDRSCNLSCPSCRTKIIVEKENKKQILKIQYKIQHEALKDADYLHITGSGDPFGSPFFRKWLQTMRSENMPNIKKIHLQTNAQLWTSKMWATIAKDVQQLIKSADISIDAASPETYAINRRGGSFEKLLENLEFIRELRKSGPLEWVCISMVVQENNFKEMPDFVRLCKRFNFDTVYFSQLVNYGAYDDEEFKNRAIHFPAHPKYSEFINILKHEILKEPLVLLGNLTETISFN